MEYKTENQNRMAQVLKALDFKFEYFEKPGFFLIREERILIYEENILKSPESSRMCYYKNKYEFVVLQNNGILQYEDGSKAVIKKCNSCKKFYFVKKNENAKTFPCPFCGSSDSKMLSNDGKLPNWYGSKTNFIIPEDALSNAINDECENRVINVINKLNGTPKVIKVTQEKIEKVRNLRIKYPNMTEPIKYICQTLEVSLASKNRNIRFKPFVLVGSPACGKTSFATDLCLILQEKKALKIDLGNNVASFTLTGSDPGFNNSKEGLIIKSMFKSDDNQPLWNPIIHFDELDKISNKEVYTIETVFYSILERNTAKNFFDNFITMNVDASGINYVFTANYLDKIPPAILSRLKIFKIPDYTFEQLFDILDFFYKNWIESHDMSPEFLPERLSLFTKKAILNLSGTDTRKIEDAINAVFEETRRTDEKSNQTIALFSPDEIYDCWEIYRGKRSFANDEWKLPENF